MIRDIEQHLGRIVVLRLESGQPLTVLGPAWAGLCGLLVSGGMGWNLHTLVVVVLLLLLVEPLMGGLWELTVNLPFAEPGGDNPGTSVDTALAGVPSPGTDDNRYDLSQVTGVLAALPYARAGSPGDRLVTALTRAVKICRAQPRRLAILALNLVFALAVASVLGAAPLFLIAVVLLTARLHWRTGTPALFVQAGYDVLVPWLMGMAALGHINGHDLSPYRPALFLLLACTVVYVVCLMVAHGAGRRAVTVLYMVQGTVLLYLLMQRETAAVWLVSMCLVGQWGAHSVLSVDASRTTYLRRSAVYIGLGMMAAALALAPGLGRL